MPTLETDGSRFEVTPLNFEAISAKILDFSSMNAIGGLIAALTHHR
jgi:hypothetical protein